MGVKILSHRSGSSEEADEEAGGGRGREVKCRGSNCHFRLVAQCKQEWNGERFILLVRTCL